MKSLHTSAILKALLPKVAIKVIESFDRVTTLVVGVCWAAAAIMIGFALYTVNLSVAAKHSVEAALAAEPFLPTISRKPVEERDIHAIIDRMQHRYPDVVFSFRNNLSVTCGDGSKFHEWLTALDYIDTVSPQIHWTLQQICAGKCGHEIMSATLTGEKIAFEKPQSASKK